ncbi:MAG TPA: AraC family transcriptional regulator [Vicinamibacterales bacterium]|nr:AraC family transcriptional regulator [Vicinamibacterales bacterium]
MDALSDVLRAVRLTGAIFFDVRVSPPWVAETPAGSKIVSSIFAAADHLIPYHVVTRGTAWARIVDGPATRLEQGDIVVFPHGDAHVISSAPGMRGRPNLKLYRHPADRQLPFVMSLGEPSAEPGHIVCGYLGCDARPFNPLIDALPPILRVGESAGGRIAAFVQYAIAESDAPRMGGESVLGRLSELMFVEVVRRYFETLPAGQTGWLAGLRDPSIGRALTALHREPARAWTLESLSRAAGLSRSALAERFTALVGQPPMQYLTHWRMQLAATDLMTGIDGVAAVADRVGYESEAAFSRAFKKNVGVPPGQWRRHRSGRAAKAARLQGATALSRDT